MMKPTIRASALGIALCLLSCASDAQAGLFSRWTKSKPAKPVAGRGQSPEGAPAAGGSWQQPPGAAPPGYTAPPVYTADECCGPDDKYGRHIAHCRRNCDQTYYPPVPPYCFPGYGYNPPCWRRMAEGYVCPRETNPLPTPRVPKAASPKTAPPPVPAIPEGTPPEPSLQGMRRSTRTPPVAPVSSLRPSQRATQRARWTEYADALPETDDIPEAPLETLEEEMAAEGDLEMESELDDTYTLEEVDDVTADDAEFETPLAR
ncbi:MAG: hypothetical protein ACKV0T_15445 [Planctomycetales bacterium]